MRKRDKFKWRNPSVTRWDKTQGARIKAIGVRLRGWRGPFRIFTADPLIFYGSNKWRRLTTRQKRELIEKLWYGSRRHFVTLGPRYRAHVCESARKQSQPF